MKEQRDAATLTEEYPALGRDLIAQMIQSWDEEEGCFAVEAVSDGRMAVGEGDFEFLTPEQLFDRHRFTQQEIEDTEDPERQEKMRQHNRQLLDLLKAEFGWQEDDPRLYPVV